MRPAAASAVLGLAFAVGAPTAWVVTRPEAAAGPSLERALPVAPEAPAAGGVLPPVKVRDAAPAAVPVTPPPVRVDLPQLGLTAPVDPVGVADDGQMALPDAAGWVMRWRVVSRDLLPKQILPVDTIFARGGPPRLVLVTCGGPYDPDARSYRDNVVVVAEPVPPAAP